jgi:hypothetical protein
MTPATTLNLKHTLIIGAALAVLMAATRFHHFGFATYLPDASLAVFFLAGFYLRGAWLLPLLLAEAAAIDYLAISVGGVSDWCITPAYAFLLPTYASMWLGGRWYARLYRPDWRTLFALGGVLLLAASVAFLISNWGFYFFSGRFGKMGWIEYSGQIARYFPHYLGGALLYVAAAAGLHALFISIGGARTARSRARPRKPSA